MLYVKIIFFCRNKLCYFLTRLFGSYLLYFMIGVDQLTVTVVFLIRYQCKRGEHIENIDSPAEAGILVFAEGAVSEPAVESVLQGIFPVIAFCRENFTVGEGRLLNIEYRLQCEFVRRGCIGEIG